MQVLTKRWRDRHLWLLVVWMALACLLRLANLTLKPLWTDEFSSIIFSLGNSYQPVPLDQAIALPTLLSPLQLRAEATPADVIRHLLTESNHPPLYFLVMYGWLRLVSASGEWVSVWAVRSLSAFLGVLLVPACFGLAWLAFRKRLVAQGAAAFVAVSPFCVYVSQEARHYTLAMLWIVASLCCLVVAVQRLANKAPLPLWLVGLWIGANGLGIATHFFFGLTLVAQALVVLGVWVWLCNRKGAMRWHAWRRLGLVAVGTAIAGVVWVPVLASIPDSALTEWIIPGESSLLAWLDPILQSMVVWITMVYLLPVGNGEWLNLLASGGLVLLVVWTIPRLVRGLAQLRQTSSHASLGLVVLGGVVVGAIALLWGMAYVLGRNLALAYRYHFVYAPAFMVLLGAGLATLWLTPPTATLDASKSSGRSLVEWRRWSQASRAIIGVIWLLSLVGSVTVVCNLAYQKTHRPDVVVATMRERSTAPSSLVAIDHRTHGQTGRLMGLAWEWQRTAETTSLPTPQFLLAHQTSEPKSAILTLRRVLREQPRPLDLWLIDFRHVPQAPLKTVLREQACTAEFQRAKTSDGYRYQLFHCDG